MSDVEVADFDAPAGICEHDVVTAYVSWSDFKPKLSTMDSDTLNYRGLQFMTSYLHNLYFYL